MNLLSFKFRLKRLFFQIIRNPLYLLKVFNLKKVFKAVKQLTNVQVPFKYLTKNYQINVLLETLKKINLISKKLSDKKNNVISENDVLKLQKKYDHDQKCQDLKNLFNKYGSGSKSSYVYIYCEIFKNFKIKSLLEIGLGTNNINLRSNIGIDGKPGGSLRAFRDYLKINVYGADVDKKILFKEEKISTYFVDQLDISSIRNLKENIPKVDLIIDDGLHQPDANLNVILELIEHLSPGGIMVIEDIEPVFKNIFKIVEKMFNKTENYQSTLIEMETDFCLVIKMK